MFRKILPVIVISFVLISACSPVSPTNIASAPSADVMTDTPVEVMTENPSNVIEQPSESVTTDTNETPAWFDIALTNAHTGATFTINDYKGKVVLVENLAMWCSNCKKQQEQVKALHQLLGDEGDLISIGLDIDSNERNDDLIAYTNSNGFDWIYTIATEEVTREIGNLYGAQFLNPPSTPILIIDRNGVVHQMPFGIKSADELKSFIEPLLSGSV